MDASFFILISFCIFSFIFARKFCPSIIGILDQHITDIKNEVFQNKHAISEHEKLKTLYQERLQHLHEEIEELKTSAFQKLDFLKVQLDTELEAQYTYRQRSFEQIIYRMQHQQRKTLQTRCVDEILKRVKEELKKKPSFNDEYMVSLLGTHGKGSNL